jgi:hypothetical protein
MTPAPDLAAELEYLCVDDFLCGLLEARALATALELTLIDRLLEPAPVAIDDAASIVGEARGSRLLLDLLAANHVVEIDGPHVRLTNRFRVALRFRDLLEAKIDFAQLVAPDVIDLFTALVRDPAEFRHRARLFDLFDYRRCLEPNAENFERTRRWVRFTTALTRYEAPVCLRRHDFGRYRRMLDIGGNSGEFVLRACKAHPDLHGAVADLPVVCDIGRAHVLAEPEAERIAFIKADALNDPLPGGFDVVTFKSVLHDWPDSETSQLLARAREALAPGGTILIFERGPVDIGNRTPPFSMIPLLLFFRSYRPAHRYEELLTRVGFTDVTVETMTLDMPFSLVTARRPS